MAKHGRTSAGAQRWRCLDCGATSSFTRQDQTGQATPTAFIDYLLGNASQGELDNTTSGSTWRRRNAWCWKGPAPTLKPTGEVYDQLFIDGGYLAYKWTLLTVINDRGRVLAWHWTDGENAAAYTALLERLAPGQLKQRKRDRHKPGQ